MAKLIKKKFYNASGESKINNYLACISKKIVEDANMTGDEQIKIYAKNNKIIIEKEV